MSTIRPAYYLDELRVGQVATQSKTLTDADILLFSAVSTDNNPIHINDEYAKSTRFGKRIVHGALSSSLISACLANQLPGVGTIYLGQNTKFVAPVHPGDTVTARLEVVDVDQVKGKVKIQTQCFVGDTLVIDGDALVLAPRRPQ